MFTVDRLALECAVVGARRIDSEVNAGGGALRCEACVGTGSEGRDRKSARLAKRMGEKDNKSTTHMQLANAHKCDKIEHRVGR